MTKYLVKIDKKMQDFFQNSNNISGSLTDAISAACEGLIYISEADAPVVPVSGTSTDVVDRETILQQTSSPSDAPLEEITFDGFFARLTTDRDWYGDVEKTRAKRYAELQTLLEGSLRDRKVFRIGTVQVDIYAVGIDKDGCLMGVTTKAVET